MKTLQEELKKNNHKNDFTLKLIDSEIHFQNILKECNYEFEYGTGSYLFEGKKYEYSIEMYPKQKLLYDIASNAQNILEIGTYMGHSILIMLLANPKANITCIDINDRYSHPSINYLKKAFPLSSINFIKGNSLDILPSLSEKFDLFHIDGSHLNHVIVKEFNFCRKISKSNKIKIIFDDIESCLKLKKNITSSFSISSFYEPVCKWGNCYMEIDFSNEIKKFNAENAVFKRLNFLDFLKDYFQIILKKVRRFPKKITKKKNIF
tara:strand:- start:1345 stop:2136 length:792 start_codon:yes stop_codon:yes gene_type:complete